MDREGPWEAATIDPVTGLPTRPAIMEMLHQALHRVRGLNMRLRA